VFGRFTSTADGDESAMQHNVYKREDDEFGRAVGFFDATYALALTLLVTTLDVGDTRANWIDLGALENAVGSQFIAFLISFGVIAMFWLHNHRLLSVFASIDLPLIILNLALVGTIVLLPFTTEALGGGKVNDLPLPTTVYAANIAAASILTAVVYEVARRRRLLKQKPDRQTARAMILGALGPAAVFLCSIPIAYLASAEAARWFWLSIVVVAPLSGSRSLRLRAG
jgi:uncharacterized membrane protein